MIQATLRKTFSVFVLFVLISDRLMSQTGGSGELSSIESKANMILKNDEKVGELNRQHLETYHLESEKLTKLKNELSALIAEKISVLDEYRRGQFCTGCSVPRSQFKAGETFPHPGQSVRAATPEELATKEKYYDDRIAAKEKEAKDFEFSENEFTRKRADIDKQMDNLKDNSDKLREEIVALSKIYKEKVMAHAKSIQAVWISDLMRMVAEKHVLEDKIAIYEVKLTDLAAEESKALADSKEKTRKQNDADIQKINGEILLENNKIVSLRQKFDVNTSSIKRITASYESRLSEVESLLEKPDKLSQQDLAALKAEESDLKQKIVSSKEDLKRLEGTFEIDLSDVKKNIKMLQDKSWALTTNLPQRQEAALVTIRQVFVTKRKLIQDALVARKASLENHGDLLVQKKTSYRQQFMVFADRVKAEQDRLVIACRNSGASCFGTDTHGDVVLQWNNAFGCVAGMENSRVMNGVYFGCEEESVVYKSHYNTKLGGLSSSDAAALQRKVTKTRYDMIFQKVID